MMSLLQLEDRLSEYENVLCAALSVIIVHEMKAAYGESLWPAVVVVAPPWTLANAIAIIDKSVLLERQLQ